MKKTALCLLVFLLLLLTACAEKPVEPPTTTSKITTSTPASTVEATEEPFEHAPYDPMKYRPIFYELASSYVELVDANELRKWIAPRTESEEYLNECVAVSFIKRFNISREDFERANEKRRIRVAEIGLEGTASGEVYDVDLIYTFDNDKINEFFLWENGPYESY